MMIAARVIEPRARVRLGWGESGGGGRPRGSEEHANTCIRAPAECRAKGVEFVARRGRIGRAERREKIAATLAGREENGLAGPGKQRKQISAGWQVYALLTMGRVGTSAPVIHVRVLAAERAARPATMRRTMEGGDSRFGNR
jgi:hypothetical protein